MYTINLLIFFHSHIRTHHETKRKLNVLSFIKRTHPKLASTRTPNFNYSNLLRKWYYTNKVPINQLILVTSSQLAGKGLKPSLTIFSKGQNNGFGRLSHSYQSQPSHMLGSRFWASCWGSLWTARMKMVTLCPGFVSSRNRLFVTVRNSILSISKPVSSFSSLLAHSSKLSPKRIPNPKFWKRLISY